MVYFGKRILNSPGSSLVAFGINKDKKKQCSLSFLISEETFTVTFFACTQDGKGKAIKVMSSLGQDPSHTASP